MVSNLIRLCPLSSGKSGRAKESEKREETKKAIQREIEKQKKERNIGSE